MVKRKTPAERTETRSDFVRGLEDNPHFHWYYAGATLLFTIILFAKFIFSSGSTILFSSDTIQTGFFWRDFITNSLRGQLLPLHPALWNMGIFCGLPTVDAFHGDIFYLPTFFLKAIMPVHKAFGFGMILHVYLSGLFAYKCARGFGLSKLAAAFAGISYMFSGYLVSLVAPGHDGKMYVTALFPLAFDQLHRGFDTRRLWHFLWLGIVIALIILTPHPQMAYFSLWGLGFYALYRVIWMLIDKQGVVKTAIAGSLFVLAVVIGLCASAIQMLPSYKYINEFSPRAGEGAEGRTGYDWAISWSMHLEEAAGQIVPLFQGVDDGKSPAAYWGRNPFKDNTEYAGYFPVFLGILGIILWRDRRTWFLLGLGVFALIYALGDTTPLFRVFYELIPNVKKMRAPSMIMFLFSFAFVMLAAYGIDAFQRLRAEKKSRTTDRLNQWLLIVAGLLTAKALLFTIAGESMMSMYTSIFYSGITDDNRGALLAGLGAIKLSLWVIAILTWLAVYLIRGYTRGQFGRIALVGLIFLSLIDLWRVDFRFISTADYNAYFRDYPVLQFLRADRGPYRVFDLTQRSFSAKNYLAMKGIEQLTGYHGSQLKTFDEFIGGLTYTNLLTSDGLRLRPLQMTNTKYVILDRGVALPPTGGIAKVYDQEVVVYQLPDVLPRAGIYHNYRIGARDQSDLQTLFAEDFSFRDELILYEEPEIKPALSPLSTTETVEILEHTQERQRYHATLNSPGLLFVSENHFPAWKAKVDGVEKKVLLANHTFRAIALDAGTHEVEIYYDWPRYEHGKWITILTTLLSLGGLAACYFVERQQRGPTA